MLRAVFCLGVSPPLPLIVSLQVQPLPQVLPIPNQGLHKGPEEGCILPPSPLGCMCDQCSMCGVSV